MKPAVKKAVKAEIPTTLPGSYALEASSFAVIMAAICPSLPPLLDLLKEDA